MKAVIGVINTWGEEVEPTCSYLAMLGFSVRLLSIDESPEERPNVDMIVVPDGQYIDSTCRGVDHQGNISVNIPPLYNQALVFRELFLPTLLKEIPIIGFGRAADLLWLASNQRLRFMDIINPEVEVSMLAFDPTIQLEDWVPGCEGHFFFESLASEQTEWKIVSGDVMPFIWSTFVNKNQLSNFKNSSQLMSKTKQVMGFQNAELNVVGIKTLPYRLHNPSLGLEYVRAGNQSYGDYFTNRWLKNTAKQLALTRVTH